MPMALTPLDAVLNTATFRTRLTKPVTLTAAELWGEYQAPTDPNSPLAPLKPTILLDTPFGPKVVAPWGMASPTEWVQNQHNAKLVGLAGVLGLLALGFVVGRAVSR